MSEILDWYKTVENRGLLNQLSEEQQQWWAEVKRRGLDKESQIEEEPQEKPSEISEPQESIQQTNTLAKLEYLNYIYKVYKINF